jgi:hypothetical protein
MNSSNITGLGEPDAGGKQALFQPPLPEADEDKVTRGKPEVKEKRISNKVNRKKTPPIRRVHITTDLTVEALQAVEAIRQDYRLKHGKVLPQWKVLSQAIAFYAKARGTGKPA